ncbi:hypothetical protein [Sphingosinicella terrae]|uniref:hypothetical protein n=1 Tax=Sphingosinicella terrae TaxID=2172047 RepID=UPI000E0D011A|nr:hypothetical protein [Sphingosinicella terrae]
MSNVIGARPPSWLRLVGFIALLWNLVGVAFYFGHVGILGGVFAPPAPGIAMPFWVSGAYAVGVFAGAIGSFGLALAREWSRLVLWISLIALAIDWGWVFLASGAGLQPLGIGVLAIAFLLVRLAATGEKKGWLD